MGKWDGLSLVNSILPVDQPPLSLILLETTIQQVDSAPLSRIPQESNVIVADNTGAKTAQVIRVLG